MISLEDARQQQKVLAEAYEASPVRAVRYRFRAVALEWKRAVSDLEASPDDDPAVIELAGTISPGMAVPAAASSEDGSPWWTVRRVMNQYGAITLHVIDDKGRDHYHNYAGNDSPVVVRA